MGVHGAGGLLLVFRATTEGLNGREWPLREEATWGLANRIAGYLYLYWCRILSILNVGYLCAGEREQDCADTWKGQPVGGLDFTR